MFAAANLAVSGPGQAAVTALTGPGKAAVGQEGDGGGRISVVATVVPLAAETIGPGSTPPIQGFGSGSTEARLLGKLPAR